MLCWGQQNYPFFSDTVLAGYAFFFKVLQNSFQKTWTFFGASGSRSIRKQITFSLTPPPAILKKIARKYVVFLHIKNHVFKTCSKEKRREERKYRVIVLTDSFFHPQQLLPRMYMLPGNGAWFLWRKNIKIVKRDSPVIYLCGSTTFSQAQLRSTAHISLERNHKGSLESCVPK